ncbi:aldo/keto reductase [Roseimarinus sediminis]|uniref:aldo/keto reductase n=1 Tax=Roseimarinus sediminis TaxID=1610899 RepID=UPI003D1FF68A
MNVQNFSEKSVLLTDISPYVYGTTRLGDETIPFDERVEIAKAAIDTGVWFHTSRMYGDALQVLRQAFDNDRGKVPELLVKLEGQSIEELLADVDHNLNPLGLDSLDLGQLCLGGDLANDFARGGKSVRAFEELKKSGKVKHFVLEVFPWTSDIAYKALSRGFTEGLIDGFIFYLNPLQRFASNQLWDLLREKSEPIVAMRTVAGGPVHRLRDEPGFAWKEYLQKRAAEVAPVFERSGVGSWTEFCVRFAHSFSQVRATVGSTAKAENLQEFLMASESIESLPYDIVDQIVKLQYRWSDELDRKAAPWTM